MGVNRAREQRLVVIGSYDRARLDRIASGRSVRSLPAPLTPWSLDSSVCVGSVVDDESHAAAIDGLLRGADLIVDVSDDRLERFIDDVERLGATIGIDDGSGDHATSIGDSDCSWGELLDHLAAGESAAAAARLSNISLRTAHRRLARAREVLEVDSTTAAVMAWRARGRSEGRVASDGSVPDQ